MIDYKANRKFFSAAGQSSKFLGMLFIVLGATNLPFLLMGLVVNGLLAVVLISLGLFVRRGSAGAVSGATIDALLKEEESKALKQALNKLGLDEDEVGAVSPLIVSGYLFANYPLGTMAQMEKATGKWRSPTGEVAVIIFSDEVLHSYKRKFSFVDPNFKGEETDEYFYKDVVSISTKTDSVPLVAGKLVGVTIPVETLSLTTSGGTSVNCSIYQSETVERALGAARNLVKEKKR